MRLLFVAALLLPSICFAQRNEPRGNPGEFDYYILSLSWSPEYCAGPAGARDSVQCGQRPYAFVLHGLWPQYERGGFPQFCREAERVPSGVVNHLLEMMPSPRLISHEWDKHGTCTNDTVRGYFAKAERAYRSVRIPGPYVRPGEYLTTTVEAIRREFVAANAGLRPGGLALLCNGRNLTEIRICLDKNLKPRVCGRRVEDECRSAQVVLRPVR